MKSKTIDKVLELFSGFRKNLEVKPPQSVMYEEIRMMKFKVKPLQGDITLLDFGNPQLIETLWQLGKLDEFFDLQFKKLTPSQQEVFFNFFNDMHNRLQSSLSRINLKSGVKSPQSSTVFEMEIIKERSERKKKN